MQVLRSFSVQKFVVPPIGTMMGFIGRRDRDSFIVAQAVILDFVPLQNPTTVLVPFGGSGGGSFGGLPSAVTNFILVNPSASGVWS